MNPEPEISVTVEYDSRGKRVQKTFADAIAGRRFFTAKDRTGKNPKVTARRLDDESPQPAIALPSVSTAEPKKNVACYVRVSTTGQNEQGQKAEIQRWLTGNGIDTSNVKWFIDKATGNNLQRPGFESLQAAVFNGEVHTVVVYKLDRLSRSLRDGINVLSDWCDKGLRVVSVTQQIDFNGTIGKMLAAVLLGIAEMEQETRRERQAAGIAVAKIAGKYRGRKKGTTKGKPSRALKLREKGLTADEIAKSLGVSRNTVFVYLRQFKS